MMQVTNLSLIPTQNIEVGNINARFNAKKETVAAMFDGQKAVRKLYLSNFEAHVKWLEDHKICKKVVKTSKVEVKK